MGRSTLPRDYDIGRKLDDYLKRIAALERRVLGLQPKIGDTGQVDLTGDLVATVTSTTLEVSRVGETVYLQGSVAPNTNWGAVMANTNLMATVLDAQFRPTQSHVFIGASSATGAMVNFRVSLQSGGQIAIRCDTLNHTGSVFLNWTYRGQ
jgi:hypothetical protein